MLTNDLEHVDELNYQLRLDAIDRLAFLKRRVIALVAESVLSGMAAVLVLACVAFTLVQWKLLREESAQSETYRFNSQVAALKEGIRSRFADAAAIDFNDRAPHLRQAFRRWLGEQDGLAVRVRIYDSDDWPREDLIFDSHPAVTVAAMEGNMALEDRHIVGGRMMRLQFSTLPTPQSKAGQSETSMALASGFPIVLILAVVFGATMRARSQTRDLIRRVNEESTARKTVEQDLAATNDELKALVKACPHAIVLEGMNGEFRVWNQAAEKLFGWTEADARKGGFKLLAKGAEEPYRLSLLEAAWNDTKLNMHTVGQRRNGEQFPAELSAAAVHDGQGAQIGHIMCFVDMTERRMVEDSMRRMQERYRSLAAAMTEVEWHADALGRFMRAQESWEKYTGQTREQYREWGYVDALHPDDQAIYKRKWTMFRVLAEPFECEVRLWHASTGTYRYVLSRCVPVCESEGQVREWVGTISDIDDRKRAEERLLDLNNQLETRVKDRTKELQTAVSQLEAFTGAVSHDLRGPLKTIDGYSATMLEDFGAILPDTGKKDIQRIRRSVTRMQQIIEDLLRLSRLAQHALVADEIDLAEIGRSVAASLQEAEPARQVEIAIPDGLVAKADPLLIRIALENLIGNAWKFTRRTEAARIELGVQEQDGGQVFFVRDNGAGFDMQYADRLFSAFHRLHSESEFPGIGIGLTTVQRIVERHGGRVWADAVVDKGATFYFTLEGAAG
jgi:PAS domain S-box-containing protein